MLSDEPRFVWLDLEMTGLNVLTDVVLEIAAVVTGPALEPLGEFHQVVHYPETVFDQMSTRVRRMHTDNGLIDAVRASTCSLAQAERNALKALSVHCQPGQAVLCGSSVHIDRRFMARHMPRLEQHLHFHQVDIATMNLLVSAWYPDKKLHERVPQPHTRHRAMTDVQASLDEMRFYCEQGFGVKLASLKRENL